MAAEQMLVAVDGSRPAQSAAMIGLWLARALDYHVYAQFIVEAAEVEDPYTERGPEVLGGRGARSPEETVALDEVYGQQVLDELILAAEALELQISSEIDFGGVVPVLKDAAEESALVTLGRRGLEHGDDEGALGSNFEALLAGLEQPLLIGGGNLPRSLDRILLAYDGSDAADAALGWAVRLRRALTGLGVDILAVEERTSSSEVAEAWLQEALSAFSATSDPPLAFTHRGEPGHEILAAAEEHGSDLILMGRPALILGGAPGKTLRNVLRGGEAVLLP
jgi:nucleotide-binding universal stress UspA family protein